MNNEVNPQKQICDFDLELLYGCVGYDYMQALEPREFNSRLALINKIDYDYSLKQKGIKLSNVVQPVRKPFKWELSKKFGHVLNKTDVVPWAWHSETFLKQAIALNETYWSEWTKQMEWNA